MRPHDKTSTAPHLSREVVGRLLDSLLAFAALLDVDGRIIEANEAGLAAGGVTIEQVRGQRFWDTVWWNYDDQVRERLRDACEEAAAGVTVRYEELVRVAGDERLLILFQVAPLRIEDGRITHLVASGVDITRRRTIERELERTTELLQTLVEVTPDPIFIKDRQGRILLANPATLAALGRNLDEVVGHSVDDWLESAEQTRAIRDSDERVMALGEPASVEEAVETPDGLRLFQTNKTPLRNDAGDVVGVMAVARDITEQKRVQAELQQLAEQRQLALDAAQLGWWVYDALTGQAHYDERFAQIYDVPGTSCPTEDILDHVHPEDRPLVWERLAAAMDPSNPVPAVIQYRLLRADGEVRWVEARGKGLLGRDGDAERVVKVVGAAQDITDRKQYQEALRESEKRFRTLADHMSQLAWMTDETGAIVWFNKRWYDYTGSTPEEASGWGWMKYQHPDHVQRVMDKIRHAFSRGEFWEDTFPLRSASGEYRWFLSRAVPIHDQNGKVISWFGTNTDVTEQRLAARNLEASERRLGLALDAAHAGAWETDLETGENIWDTRVAALLGLGSPDEGQQNWLDFIHPHDRDRVEAAFEASSKIGGPPFNVQFRAVRADGAVIWFHSRGLAVQGPSGHRRIVGVVQDVSEQHNAEEALRASQERYRMVNQATHDVIWDWHLHSNRMEWSESIESAFGLTREELGSTVEGWYDRIHPDDRERVVSGIHRAIASGHQKWSDEYRFRRKDGSFGVFLDRGLIARNHRGEAYRMIGSMLDVTDRRRADEALRASEERFRTLADAMPQLVWTADPDGRVEYYNARVHQLQGVSFEEATGQWRWDPALHPDDQQRTVEAWENAIRHGHEYRIEHRVGVRGQNEDAGRYRWFLSRAVPARDSSGRIIKWYGTATDIHNLKETEQALARTRDELEQRVAERTEELQRRADQLSQLTSELTLAEQRERHRLAKVLHDHLQQLLVGAKFGLHSLAAPHQENDPSALRRVHALIDEAIQASRSLTVELSPPILHEAGFAAALAWLARWMEQKHDLHVHLQIEEHVEVQREDVRVLYFEAVRELLFNVVKHARTREAWVELAAEDSQTFRVTVSDKGVGFDPTAALKRSPEAEGGFGLFSIRERLSLLGGKFEMDSAPGHGARFTLTGPTRGVAPAVIEESTAAAETRKARSRRAAGKAATAGTIRLLLADDHDVVRQGLAGVISGEADMDVIAQASDGEEAVQLTAELEPDIVLMDFSMPKLNGVEATRQIRQLRPNVQVIGLSMYEEADRARAMAEAGAAAYLSKSGNLDRLLQTVRSIKSAAEV